MKILIKEMEGRRKRSLSGIRAIAAGWQPDGNQSNGVIFTDIHI